MSEDVGRRFEAYGWTVMHVDGHNAEQVSAAYDRAIAGTGAPVLICARTVIGHGAPTKSNSSKAHGEPLGASEAAGAKRAAGWPEDKTFYVPDEVRALWAERAKTLAAEHDAWTKHEAAWLAANADKADLYRALSTRSTPADLLDRLAAAVPAQTDATRSLASTVMQTLGALMPSLVGGDADLGGSTKTVLKDSPKVLPGRFEGRNLRFGIREHAMGAVANGLALHGMFVPYTATFLTFSDYMRGAIRLSALCELPVVNVFTHDSIFLGEDGPTHQSVEHVSALRLIPNVHVWRTADGLECAAAWASAATRRDGPTQLVFTRQKVDTLPAHTAHDAARGGYVLVREEGGDPDVVFLATGSEVGLAVGAAKVLAAEGCRVRVVSLPCMEVFQSQPEAYRASVLPAKGRRVSVEAGRTDLWRAWVGSDGACVGVDRFGASAPAPVLAEKYGLTVEAVVAAARG